MSIGFLDALQENDKKGLFLSDDDFCNYSTGILPFDYANGFYRKIYDDKENPLKYRLKPVTGILGGTIISVIGETGSGKTTFADQIGYSIIRRFHNGLMQHVDAEKTATKERILQLAQAEPREKRILLNKNHTTTDDILEVVDRICNTKERFGKDMKYEVPELHADGTAGLVWVPSVLIIDSLASFTSAEKNISDMGTNMDGARDAKALSTFLNNILDRLWQYNITLICTNHIRPKINMPMQGSGPRGMMMLNNNVECLPRGQVSQYYSHTCIRINSTKGNMCTIGEDGYNGFKSNFILAKSKSNFIGSTFRVAFDADYGFDPYYTLYYFAEDQNLIEGRNPYLRFKGHDNMKFNRKDFRNRFLDDEAFQAMVMTEIYPYLEAMLGSKDSSANERIPYGQVFDNIIPELEKANIDPSTIVTEDAA